MKVRVGKDFTLWCNATGYPRAVVYWTREDGNRRLRDGSYQFWVRNKVRNLGVVVIDFPGDFDCLFSVNSSWYMVYFILHFLILLNFYFPAKDYFPLERTCTFSLFSQELCIGF